MLAVGHFTGKTMIRNRSGGECHLSMPHLSSTRHRRSKRDTRESQEVLPALPSTVARETSSSIHASLSHRLFCWLEKQSRRHLRRLVQYRLTPFPSADWPHFRMVPVSLGRSQGSRDRGLRDYRSHMVAVATPTLHLVLMLPAKSHSRVTSVSSASVIAVFPSHKSCRSSVVH